MFTVKSAYKLDTRDNNIVFMGGASSAASNDTRSIWNCIWKSSVPQKMKISAWKVVTGVLPTEQYKMYGHLSKRSTYPLCGVEEKGMFHALVSCAHARLLWVNMRARWPLPCDDLLVDNGKEWLIHLLNRCSDDV